jgi:hypothetical protein
MMVLNWIDIRHYKSLSDADKKAGIYIWGFNIKGRFVKYYVGKAQNVGWRLTEHITSVLTGNYRIYKKEHVENYLHHEPIYKPGPIEGKVDFLQKRVGEWKTDIEYMAENFWFTYAEMSLSDFKASGIDAEGCVIDTFGINNLINHRRTAPTKQFEMGNLQKVLNQQLPN